MVQINTPINSSIPDVYAVNPGGAVNTIYRGYGPSSVTLQATVSGGTSPYTYRWTLGSTSGPVVSNSASCSIGPSSSTTYYLSVKDKNGCNAEVVQKTINVVDIRCGAKLDRVKVCQVVNRKLTDTCVTDKEVKSLLAAGATLGSCPPAAVTTKAIQPVEELMEKTAFQITASPNPAPYTFNVQVTSGNPHAPIQLRVVDLLGRTMEMRNNVAPNSNLKIGGSYKAGVYLVEVIQGNERRHLKLIKQ
jgi:hypothetical protein